MAFDSKNSKTGDKLTLDAVDEGKNGGTVSGYDSILIRKSANIN